MLREANLETRAAWQQLASEKRGVWSYCESKKHASPSELRTSHVQQSTELRGSADVTSGDGAGLRLVQSLRQRHGSRTLVTATVL